jgi:hypothetical protein
MRSTALTLALALIAAAPAAVEAQRPAAAPPSAAEERRHSTPDATHHREWVSRDALHAPSGAPLRPGSSAGDRMDRRAPAPPRRTHLSRAERDLLAALDWAHERWHREHGWNGRNRRWIARHDRFHDLLEREYAYWSPDRSRSGRHASLGHRAPRVGDHAWLRGLFQDALAAR